MQQVIYAGITTSMLVSIVMTGDPVVQLIRRSLNTIRVLSYYTGEILMQVPYNVCPFCEGREVFTLPEPIIGVKYLICLHK